MVDGELNKRIVDGLNETAKAVNRLMLTLLALGLFSLLAVGLPDAYLLSPANTVSVPSVGAVSAKVLLIVGPLLLIGTRIYLQIYVNHWSRLNAIADARKLKRAFVVSPMRHKMLRLLAAAVLYLMVPAVLAAFTWKAMVVPKWWGFGLLVITVMATAAHLFQDLKLSRNAWVAVIGVAAVLNATLTLRDNNDAYFRRPFDLRYANLSKTDLSGRDLRDADVRQAELIGADLTGADLRGANFWRTQLAQAVFRDCNLEKANFTGADLAEVDFLNARLAGVLFKNANMRKVRFGLWVDINSTDWWNRKTHQFDGVTFAKADLRGADFRNAWLKNVGFEDADLSDADFGDATLIEAIFNHAKLHGARFSSANLSNASLMYADFRDANLMRSDMSGAQMIGADLTGANLAKANLTGAYLDQAKFRGAYVPRTNFRNVKYLGDDALKGACWRWPTGLIFDDLAGAPVNLPEGFTVPVCKADSTVKWYEP